MNEQTLMERAAGTLQNLSGPLGSEHVIANVLIIILLIVTVLIGLGLVTLLFSSRRKGDEQWAARLEGLLGKFERTERQLNEFRSDSLRHLEVSRTELEYLRSEFESIRELLAQQVERGIHEPPLDDLVVERKARERRPTKWSATTDFERPVVAPLSTEPSPKVLSHPAAEAYTPESPTSESPALERRTEAELSAKTFEVASETPVQITAPAEPPPVVAEPVAPLAQRLKKSRIGFFEKIRSVFAGKPKLDEESVADLEAILVGSDLGINTATGLLTELKEDVRGGADISELGLAGILKHKLLSILEQGTPRAPLTAPRRREDGPVIVMVVGVNGVGKTTSVAKLAHQWKQQGSSVLLVAADTFRAAAVEQLHEWGRRLGVPVVSGAPNAKPQTVVYDAMVRAAQEPVDVVLIDTAGRLHTKQNLMEELEGIRNAIQRHIPSAPDEVILVVDGSTGQNAIVQAREFNAATALTGLIVTKLDGTSKGGVVVAIKEELGVPIRYIGVGEAADDLRPFVPRDFVEALLGEQPNETAGAPSVNAATRRQRRAAL